MLITKKSKNTETYTQITTLPYATLWWAYFALGNKIVKNYDVKYLLIALKTVISIRWHDWIILVPTEKTQSYKEKMTMILEEFSNIELNFLINVSPLLKEEKKSSQRDRFIHYYINVYQYIVYLQLKIKLNLKNTYIYRFNRGQNSAKILSSIWNTKFAKERRTNSSHSLSCRNGRWHTLFFLDSSSHS